MFITHPHFEFHVPAALGESSFRRWRLIEFDIHLAWFIVSIEERDPEAGMGFVQTYFFAWETDLTAFLPTVDQKRVVGLVCMEPAWSASAGCWTSHQVLEVWRAEDAEGRSYIELIGKDGAKLNVGLPSEASSAPVKRVPLLKLQERNSVSQRDQRVA